MGRPRKQGVFGRAHGGIGGAVVLYRALAGKAANSQSWFQEAAGDGRGKLGYAVGFAEGVQCGAGECDMGGSGSDFGRLPAEIIVPAREGRGVDHARGLSEAGSCEGIRGPEGQFGGDNGSPASVSLNRPR